MWLLLMAVMLIVMILAVSIYLVYTTLYPRVISYEDTYAHELDDGQYSEDYFKGLPKDEFYVASDHGYPLHGIWIPLEGSKKTVVLAHGYMFSLFGSVKYIPLFRGMGFNTLIYDHRKHGLSGGSSVTFGAYEMDDLKTMIRVAINRTGDDGIVGTHGESMGGATVLMEAAMASESSFIIADCAYARLDVELAHRLKAQYHLPAFPIIYVASVINRFITGWFYDQISPMSSALKIQVPTMLIHGTDDDHTPMIQSDMIYSNLDCPKSYYKAQGARHANSLTNNPEKYRSEVADFLGRHGFI